MNNDPLLTAASWAQIISVIIAVIAIITSIVVTIWVYLRSRQKRELTCSFGEIVTPIELKSGSAFRGDITILYQNRPIDNLFVSRATLKNTGNQPIRASEVVEPITFTFPSDTQIIKEPQLIQTNPENLKVKWQLNQPNATNLVNSATLEFPLFNPGESFTVDFVCTGKVEKPRILARIEGMSFVYVSRENITNNSLSLIALGALGILLGVLAERFLDVWSDQISTLIIFLMSIVLATTIMASRYIEFRSFLKD